MSFNNFIISKNSHSFWKMMVNAMNCVLYYRMHSMLNNDLLRAQRSRRHQGLPASAAGEAEITRVGL